MKSDSGYIPIATTSTPLPGSREKERTDREREEQRGREKGREKERGDERQERRVERTGQRTVLVGPLSTHLAFRVRPVPTLEDIMGRK